MKPVAFQMVMPVMVGMTQSRNPMRSYSAVGPCSGVKKTVIQTVREFKTSIMIFFNMKKYQKISSSSTPMSHHTPGQWWELQLVIKARARGLLAHDSKL